MRRVHLAVVASLVIPIMPACGGGDDDAAATTTTTTSTTTTTTTTTSSTTSTTTTTTAPNYGTVSTTTTLAPGESAIDRDDVPETRGVYEVTFGQATINGITYPNAMSTAVSSGTGEVQINAGRSRKRFLGDLGIPDFEDSTTRYHVEISLDNGAAVFATDVAFGETKRIDLPIENVLRVKIRLTRLDQVARDYAIAIGSPRFG